MAAEARSATDLAATRTALVDHLDRFQAGLSEDERVALQSLIARGTGSLDLVRLANVAAEDILDPEELALVRQLTDEQPDGPALPATLAVIAKSTRLCNLRCTYCNAWAEGPDQQMTFEVLARLTHGLLRNPGVEGVTFVWHGGEPTLRPTSFYLKALWLQQQWRREGQTVSNQLQTNGTRLTPEFVEMCRRFQISVSVSLDGPPEIHDRQRRDAAGRPTSERVHEGLRTLRDAGLGDGVLMVIDHDTVQLGPQRVLDYLLGLEVPAVGLLNAVPGLGPDGVNADDTWLPWDEWLRFLRDLFRLWWPVSDQLAIRELTELVRAMGGESAHKCHYHRDCFSYAFTVEPDGQVGPCDKYVGAPGLTWGSVAVSPVAEVFTSAGVQAQRAHDAAEIEPFEACRWVEVCNGGCPYDRTVNRGRGVEGPEGCCGLGPLLDDMEATLSGDLGSDAVGNAFRIGPLDGAVRAVPVSIGRRPEPAV